MGLDAADFTRPESFHFTVRIVDRLKYIKTPLLLRR